MLIATLTTPFVGFAAPDQPVGYHRALKAGFLARVFAVRHVHCGGKLLPVAQRGSFRLHRCTDCHAVVKDVA